MKSRIEGLEARYIFSPDLEGMHFNKPGGRLISATRKEMPTYPPVGHPLVWVHPETGRRVLNISTLNIQSIIRLPETEGDALIQLLIDHALQPRFQYIHDWQKTISWCGTIAAPCTWLLGTRWRKCAYSSAALFGKPLQNGSRVS